MLKTPYLGPVIAAMLLAGATVSLATPTSGGGATARDHVKTSAAGINAWDGRRLESAGITVVGDGDLGAGVAGATWDEGVVRPDQSTADGASSTGEFAGASKLANLGPDAETDALPLSQFAGSHAKPAPAHSEGVWGIVDKVRYGRLPEPASWALMLIGFGMIGAALRGFIVANRRLARLQPEDTE
jgi:hypothetical protein